MMDANELERAKAYAESIVWRLETLQSRSRYNIDTGKLKRLPTRLRRFSNGIPQDNVASTLEALEAMAPYRGVIYNGEDDLDHEYRPTTTLIRKDDSMKSGGDATYTIIQDLILMGERDLYLMGDSSSCSQVSETEWHWDEGEIVECPQGGQGVSYRIENVSRSAENDLFSYAVRKVQAVTQHMPPMTVECSEDSVVTLETWDNVYGEPGAFRWDDVVHDGGALDIPNPCTGKSGLLVRVQVQENPDCTFKVSVERTTSKVDEAAEYMRYRDQYKIQTMDLVTHAAKPLSKAGVEYSDGVMTKYEVKQNPDGTYDNRTTVETEREVVESTVLKRVTPFHTVVERTDTNVKSPLTGLPAGAKYGTYESTKTPGGRYTVKLTTLEYRYDSSALSCKKTIFQHDHSVDTSVAEMPVATHVVNAANGVIHDVRFRTDEMGGVVKTESTTTELQVPSSMKETLKTPRFTVISRIDTNMGSAASGLAGGLYGSYKSTRTPGGLYTNEYRYYTPTYLRFAASCSKTIFQHEHSTESTVSGGVAGSDVQSAGGGRVYSRQDRMGEEGVVVRTERYVQEIAAPSSSIEVVKTPRAIVTRQTDTNMSEKAGALKKGQFGSYKYTVTPGGWFVNEYLSVEMNPGAKSQKSRTRDAFREEHVDTESAAGLAAVPEHVDEANNGRILKKEGHVDDQGITTVTTTEVKELNVNHAEVKLVRTSRGTIKTVKHRNVQGKPASDLASQAGGFKSKEPGTAEERTTNPGRTTDITETEFLPAEGLRSADACQVVSTEHTHRSSEVVGANEKVEAKTGAKAGGGKYSSEEITVKEDGAKVRETVEVTEYNRIYGSRVHEDALQSYRVVDKTSDATNIGDTNHRSDIGDADHGGSGRAGSASELTVPAKFGERDGTCKGSSSTNSGASVELSGDLTLAPAAPQSGFKRGVHVDQDSELTKGGRFRTKDYKFIARPHKWKDFIKTEHYISLKWTFRNLTAGEIRPLVQEVVEKAALYCRGTFTVRPDVNRTLNDFGLYDGTVSFVASSPPNVGSCATGKRQIPQADRQSATKIADWWEKSISIVPVTSLNPTEYTGTAWFRVNVEWRHLEQGWGRGEQEYRNFLQGDNHSFWADSRHSYNVESQLFTYTKVKERRVYVYLQKGDAVSSSSTKPTLSSGAVNSLSEHNRDSSELGS